MTYTSQSPEDIERDIKGTRSRLDSTLGALQDRMSVGNLVDEAMGLLNGAPSDAASAVGREVRANPLPIALAAGGIAWYLFGRKKPDTSVAPHDVTANDTRDDLSHDERMTILRLRGIESTKSRIVRSQGETDEAFKRRLYTAYGDVLEINRTDTDTDESYLDRVKDSITKLGDKASGMADRLTAKASSVGSAVRDHATNAAAATADAGVRARDAASAAGRSTRDAAAHAGQSARRATSNASAGTAEFYEKNPIVSGLLAVAAGAVVGSMFAPTRTEQKYGAPLVDELSAAAASLAEDAEGFAKDSAEKLSEKVKEKAESHGMSAPTANGHDPQSSATLN